eukprot:1160085-Pelagomonas_calceolata.AAC.4
MRLQEQLQTTKYMRTAWRLSLSRISNVQWQHVLTCCNVSACNVATSLHVRRASECKHQGLKKRPEHSITSVVAYLHAESCPLWCKLTLVQCQMLYLLPDLCCKPSLHGVVTCFLPDLLPAPRQNSRMQSLAYMVVSDAFLPLPDVQQSDALIGGGRRLFRSDAY